MRIEDPGAEAADGRYPTPREVLREHGGLWFYDESYVISRRRSDAGRTSMMPAPATKLEVTDRPSPPEAIADFTRGFSLEATRPSADDVDALAAIAPAGTHVYLSAVWTRPPQEVVAAAALLRRAGLEPVPHLAVRNIASVSALDEFLAELAAEAGVRRLLVIAGDSDKPAGAFRSAIEVIDGGALRRHGISEIGIAGYPDGHPASRSKTSTARRRQDQRRRDDRAAVHIVTRSVSMRRRSRRDARLRDFGIEHPVRVGLAGPTSLATLLRYAKRCGVCASAQGLARASWAPRQLFAMSTPDALVRTSRRGGASAARSRRTSRSADLRSPRAGPRRVAERTRIDAAFGSRTVKTEPRPPGWSRSRRLPSCAQACGDGKGAGPP